MRKYGIPYKGSKNKIAEEILEQLPSGKRLVDLFGGGFAITHCALEKYPSKWERFLYNDINPLLAPLIKDAIAGKYNYNVFKPEWISREEFYKKKDTDGYVKWIWSFGNNGNDYLYGRNIEEQKKKIHEFIVFGIPSDITDGCKLNMSDIKERRLAWTRYAKSINKRNDCDSLLHLEKLQSLSELQKEPHRLQQLERLQHLSQLESLSRLENLSRFNMLNIDYREYKYQEGDVVYCDIPYEDSVNPKDYGGGFDHKAFYEWAKAQPYPIYYSSYTKGNMIWQKSIRSVMNSANGGVMRNEALFKI